MKVLYVTSESYPFAVSGGLGDVAYALPKALRRRLIGCRVVLPLYSAVPQELRDNMKFLTSFSVPVSWRRQYCGVFEAKVGGVIYYLLDNQYYFKRDGLYGHYDDAERFAFLSRAVLEMLEHIDFAPEIIHCNDWQTALTPVYLSLFYSRSEKLKSIKSVFTIHNIQYQGKYGTEILEDVFGLSGQDEQMLKYDDCVNLMKGAVEAAHKVTTVSPTYAREILDPWYSHGLDPILKERMWKLGGIINGIDYDVYNPAQDNDIFESYSAEDMAGKTVNKSGLQKLAGLPESPDPPLVGVISRLVEHKGFDLVREIMQGLLERDVQVVLLGAGDWVYENYFKGLAEKFPKKISVTLGFDPALAHKIYAGSDIFLMPSKSEPCGLAQMVALRYGSIPVVRETGGLRDTVSDSGDGQGNGFTFQGYDSTDFFFAVTRALEAYAQRDSWSELVARAMACDNSWGRSANEYIRLYKSLLK